MGFGVGLNIGLEIFVLLFRLDVVFLRVVVYGVLLKGFGHQKIVEAAAEHDFSVLAKLIVAAAAAVLFSCTERKQETEFFVYMRLSKRKERNVKNAVSFVKGNDFASKTKKTTSDGKKQGGKMNIHLKLGTKIVFFCSTKIDKTKGRMEKTKRNVEVPMRTNKK